MYVNHMTMAEAQAEKELLESELANRHPNRDYEQIEWDLEDVNGRIDELTDWY